MPDEIIRLLYTIPLPHLCMVITGISVPSGQPGIPVPSPQPFLHSWYQLSDSPPSPVQYLITQGVLTGPLQTSVTRFIMTPLFMAVQHTNRGKKTLLTISWKYFNQGGKCKLCLISLVLIHIVRTCKWNNLFLCLEFSWGVTFFH